MTDLQNAIEQRRSRRKYLPAPIHLSAAEKLRALISEYNVKAKLHFELGAGGGAWMFGNGAEYKRNEP